jgi:diguanylate cyclase (GGDEF)-like protein/PAS domain S-box-containing protein
MATSGKNTDGTSPLQLRLQILVPSVIVLIGVAFSAFYADLQQQRLSHQTAQNVVTERLALIRTKLEANVNANIHLMQGLAAVIATEPHMTQQRFGALAEKLLTNPSQIRNLAAAPNLITTFVYPYEPNKEFIGRRLLSSLGEENARLFREEGKSMIRGPLPLKSGLVGLIITLPVEIRNDVGDEALWGGIAGVVDLQRVYNESGLLAPDLALSVAISVLSEDNGHRAVIYGDGDILNREPVMMSIDLGNQQWTIAAVPQSGWDAVSSPPFFRAMIIALAGAVAGTIIWVALLMAERHKNYAALRQQEAELRTMSHRLGAALEVSRIGVWELDVDTGDLVWDVRIYQLYGLSPDTTMTRELWRSMVHPEDVERIEDGIALAVAEDRTYSGEFRVIRTDGVVVHFRTVANGFHNSEGHQIILGVTWDVSADTRLQEELREAQRQTAQRNDELEAARRRMEHNALHDALTGLPNRRYLDEKLAQLNDDQNSDQRLAVLHIDLDRFKEINDTMGHGAGDSILRYVAQELRNKAAASDFVARIGGDEFVVVRTGGENGNDYGSLGSTLIAAINQPIVYSGHECRVGASIGIAEKIEAGLTSEQLLVNADIALYEAKRRGRNRVEHFNDHLRSRTINIKNTADAILRSLGDQDFIAWYQPQFDASSLEINGVEALARWRHPQKGILTPNKFLEIAESLNVVAQLDASILDQALQQLRRWQSEGLGIEHVSVNISAQRLFDDALLEHLEKLSFTPGSLSFELLESISFDDKADAVAESLERIRSHGISVEIDDFGTGYASILSLIKLSPSRLKIDRQLTAPIVTNPTQRRLISSIVDIGRSFGIGIVAEGVETMEHAAILRDLGCQTLQGYALAHPMSPDAFIAFARDHSNRKKELWQRRA